MYFILILFFFDQIKSQKIAFGSCYNYEDPESLIFFEIAKHKPDTFVWLGDAAYVTSKTNQNRRMSELNETIIEYKFNLTKYNPGYQKLLNATQINGIWDDHDYNERDGIYSNPVKEMTRQLFLNFLDVKIDDERRFKKDGIYYSFKLKNTKIILLDVRWNRNPEQQDVLGQNQWIWLENELQDNEVDLFIIGSGSQILPNDRLFIDVWYLSSRNKLLSILKGKNVLLMTGDVHFAEILQDPCTNIIEVCSSGLSYGSHYRNILRGLFEFFAEIFQPDTYSQYYERFADKNYAIIDIDEKKISIYNESSLLYQVDFNKTTSIKCEDLESTPLIFKYFWNFKDKLNAFFSMLLFYQIVKALKLCIILLVLIILCVFGILKFFGLSIIIKRKTNEKIKQKNE
ncbi:unnamed protein product [Paramecium primaurelia]|uniref:PhoD-like phosphatase metallophosphatase domain-containing protein n=1 Tax=Paramecium primaurelia TaxID=5886 RepID=A0A8S1KTQ4_PARPR|nr:unnamed protein product [Paramecium primaurelia]